jgi:hypothetical protein
MDVTVSKYSPTMHAVSACQASPGRLPPSAPGLRSAASLRDTIREGKLFSRGSFDDSDLQLVRPNPFNFPDDLVLRNPSSPAEKQKAAAQVFGASLLAQCNRSVQFEFAGLVAEWAPAHACLAALGQSLADVARICLQGEENSADLSRFFAFTQPQQAGAVALEHNPFFTQSAIPSDWTLREMGAAVNQMIGVTLLRMLRQIDRDPRLQEKVAGLLDMDFYRKLEAQCGVNSQYDILEITTLRNKLYTEANGTQVRFASPPAFRMANRNAGRLELTQREHRFAGSAPRVPRSAGVQQFRLNPDAQYARQAQQCNEPTTAGPSGTVLNFVLVARMVWPAIERRLNYGTAPLSGAYAPVPSFARLFALTMMGYLHGSQESEHHHSMLEVLDGMQRADMVIAQCKANGLDGSGCFGIADLSVGGLMQAFITGLRRLDLNG